MESFLMKFYPIIEINLNVCITILLTILLLYYIYIFITFNDKYVDLSYIEVDPDRKVQSDLPPTYPNGWIPVIESRNIGLNQLKNLKAFGQQLVAFRSQTGRVYVYDAYCPHLGANIGVGGQITKECGHECIRCPFHGWAFKADDGLCIKIPGMQSNEIPTARLKTWETIEINATVFVWYHSHGVKPYWFPNEIHEIENNEWIYEGRTEHIVKCHFQEIPENGADWAHIQELHTPAVMAGNVINRSRFYSLLTKLFGHEWQSKWWPSSAPDSHIAHMSLTTTNTVFGYPLLTIHFNIRQIGPAFVELLYESSAFGGITGTFIQLITPLDVNRNRIIHQIYSSQTFCGKLLAKFLLYGELRMLERDIIIWNNKKFLKNPIITKNEKSLLQFRRWFNQFYTKEDPRKQW
ncbi:cholesterol 7-desaturase nvd-like [Oppia nitens]|uniref:cholesterol 7-desaturase nvd-like n=1 Tax=Oppia nitens TaxID=1686743 RepID=UPI0023DC0151|nr:cholesterol 7-desaturase nvd-like [Oppia nitens]